MPIQKVEIDMIRIDQDSALRRPYLSPKCPQTSPPSGRTINDSANTANVASSAVVLSVCGKNVSAMTVAR
ncbi:hypothetical protein D3C80_1177380 [compost metagenome]